MKKKKKAGKFNATKAVKAKAREVIGPPRPVRREESTKRQGENKHKQTIGKLLAGE